MKSHKRQLIEKWLWELFPDDKLNEIEKELLEAIEKDNPEQFSREDKPSFERRKYMRDQAICIFELTKGFTGEPITNSGKAMMEMAGYVMELTAYDYINSPEYLKAKS